jgi:hypothetical protein
MTTWPSSNKAVTTTTDSDADTISGARIDINKTIANVNDIIDIFNIPSSPTNDYILKYDTGTGKFQMEADTGSGGGGLAFKNIDVDGLGIYVDDDYVVTGYVADDIIEADITEDTLTLEAGSGISFSQDTATDTITISATSASEVNDLTSSVTWANVPDANITQSSVTQHQAALSITESQISDLGSYLVAADITGKLDLTGGTMTGAIAMSTNKITGLGDPTANQDAATKAYVDSASTGITDIVSDLTPQLGGPLDVNGNDISDSTDDSVSFADHILVKSAKSIRLADSDSSNYVSLASPATVSANVNFILPATDGTANQVLKTDGSGNLSFVNPVLADTYHSSTDTNGALGFDGDDGRVQFIRMQNNGNLTISSMTNFANGSQMTVIFYNDTASSHDVLFPVGNGFENVNSSGSYSIASAKAAQFTLTQAGDVSVGQTSKTYVILEGNNLD